MGSLHRDCYECGKTCINGQFCADGDHPSSQISLPRTLKVKVIANPVYWGFAGTNDDNVLVSGYAYYSNGFYDFFYGFEENHIGCKTCGRYAPEICSKTEQRPDVGFRSVVDVDGSVKHYNGTSEENITRGGAEVFLIDREAIKSADASSCDSTDPENVFRKTPDNFGFGNKILFKDSIYKNSTGAWRLVSCTECYEDKTEKYIDTKLPVCTTGTSGNFLSKQNIRVDDHFGEYYDRAKTYCTNHSSLDHCIPDGGRPLNYGGKLLSFKRNEDTNNLIKATISYFDGPAVALKNGDYMTFEASGTSNDIGCYVYEVVHDTDRTSCILHDTFGASTIDYSGLSSDTWAVYNTIDPETCCGGSAYGVDNVTKSISPDMPYHVDVRKVFNNSKNKLYSNREKFIAGKPRNDYSRVQTVSGIPYTGEDGEVVHVGEYPYYGPWYEADVHDTLLRTSKEEHTNYKNGTCYTRKQELTIFPDCITQSYEYDDCLEGPTHKQNIVPRLTFVYRPCNYNSNCEFSEDGRPMTAGASGMPQTIEDLRNGFGGQEIVMHINLGMAWGNRTRDLEPCDCDDDSVIGEIPFDPEVKVLSPLTFPCFPKFDLRPEEYGCLDPMWFNKIRKILEPSYDPAECVETEYDACIVKQPYTTYGYIRNICGSKDNNRIDVLKSLGERQHSATYMDTNPENSELVEPMYVRFPRPFEETGLGFPTGGNNGFIDENEDGIPDNSGEQQYRAFWGLTDNQGRLAFPYFYTKISYGSQPCPDPDPIIYSYVNFDYIKYLTDGFPTDAVPFLIEIDHEDYCVGCATNQIEEKEYFITIESLPTKYFRGSATVDATALDGHEGSSFKYGFNHCKYPGVYAIPKWEVNSETNVERWLVPTGCTSGSDYVPLTSSYPDGNPYTGETCGCLGAGVTVPMRVHNLVGTNMPKYLSTDGGINSYLPFPQACSEPRNTTDKIMRDYTVYFAAHIHCGSLSNAITTYEAGERDYGNLADYLGCGVCSHSYPATNSKPNLSLDFWYVRKGWESWFEGFTDSQLTNAEIVNFLENGAGFGFLGPYANESAPGQLHAYPIGVAPLATCTGGKIVMDDCYPYGDDSCNMCIGGFELAASYGYDPDGSIPGCYHYRNSRTIRLGTSVPGCYGASIKLYGYSYFKEPGPSKGTEGGFSRFFNISAGTIGLYSGCCELDSCFMGECPYTDPAYYTTIPGFISQEDTGTCWPCEDYKISCLGPCAALHAAMDCYDKEFNAIDCCRINKNLFNHNGVPINHPMWENHCYAKGLEAEDLIGEFTWYPETSGMITIGGVSKVSVCPAGYYGSINACHAELFFARGGGGPGTARGFSGPIVMWEGFNIPGVGNVRAAVGEPVARRVSGSPMQKVGISACALDSGPNKTTYVASEFTRSQRMIDKYGPDEVDIHLGPVTCNKNLANTVVPGTCVRPIYPNTMSNISSPSATKVAVNKETAFPEVMTVHRIECSGDGYALHVSREYYEHDRIAYATEKYVIPGPPPTFVVNKYPIYGELDGGRQVRLYENPSTGNNKNLYVKVCNIDDLPPDSTPMELLDYPIIIPMLAESDFVSPCYIDESGQTCVWADEPFRRALCATFDHSGTYTGGNGSGASGYFQSDADGCLTFILENSGQDYFFTNSDGLIIPCAEAIYDNPCVGLTLSVDPDEYFINGFAIDYTACNIPEPGGGKKGDEPDPVDYCQFPPNQTWPVEIISCDSSPIITCGKTTDVCEPPDGEPVYPNFYNDGEGTPLWNYYNLVYDNGVLDGRFLTDSSILGAVYFPAAKPGERPLPFPKNRTVVGHEDVKTGFVNGSLISNLSPLGSGDFSDFTCSYSCIQDASECGGEFFNNKEFFPRRAYKEGTKVTRYGSLSICAQNAEHSWGSWLHGHVSNKVTKTLELGGMDDVRWTSLVDPSKSGAYTVLTKDVAIEDEIIYVEEITPLLSAKHPFFKLLNPQSLDSKSCLMPDSGCLNILPTHNNSTSYGIEEERFFSGQDVYYTNRALIQTAIASGILDHDGCLLDPFRIMVDVEPCNERLSHPGTSYPMNLSWVVQGVNAGVCRGWLYKRPGPCADSTCDTRLGAFGAEAMFGPSRTETLYKCTSPDGENVFCQWEPISQGDCYPNSPGLCGVVTWTEYQVFTGVDGKDYFFGGGQSYSLQTAANKENLGGAQNLDCTFSNPFGNSNPGTYGHCAHEGYYDYPPLCHNPPLQNCGPGVPNPCHTPIGYHYGNKAYSPSFVYENSFCYLVTNMFRFDQLLNNVDAGNCPLTAVRTGYRDINLHPDQYCEIFAQAYNDYDCYVTNFIQECPFPSILKITLTE